MRHAISIWFFIFCFSISFSQLNVSVQVKAAKIVGDMKPFWSFFGYDEPNFTYRDNGKKLLSELKQLSPVTVYVRTHNILTSKGNSAGPDLKWGFTDAY